MWAKTAPAPGARRRHLHESVGRILRLPGTGVVAVVYELTGNGAYLTVVRGTAQYPRGGHNLFATAAEIESAPEVALADSIGVDS